MMNRVFWVFLLMVFVVPGTRAQNNNLTELIESWRVAYDVPGMSVGVIHEGEVILSEGFGVLEEGKKQKADKNTLYSIASNTKAFISASMAVLVREGKVNWDDPVRNYLPYFELYDPCVSEMMTIRDLLCHRSGLGTFSGDVTWYRSDYSAEEVVKRIAVLEPKFDFRSGYGYSNVMFLAAGEVIRNVTGKSWDEFAKEHFLMPLDMNRTLTSINKFPSTSNIATPHKYVNDINKPIAWVEWDNMGAAGGIISSVDDMLKWMRFQLNHGISGQDTFFNIADQKTMWTPQVSFEVSDRTRDLFGDQNFRGYGLGWGVTEYNGRLMVSHTGGYDGMYSAVLLLPNEKTGVVVLTNSMTSIGSLLGWEIFDRLLELPQQNWKEMGVERIQSNIERHAKRVNERKSARVMDTSPSMAADVISGMYRCPMVGDIEIAGDKKDLIINFVSSPGLKASLTHWHYDTYRLEWHEDQAWFDFGTVQILMDNNGSPSGLLFDVPNDDIFFYEIEAVRVN